LETLLIPSESVSVIPAERVLVIAPHPDDEVFGCGGAILRHLAAGAAVHVRIWTRGGYGTKPGHKAEYVEARQRESLAAAQVLGYGTPEFGDADDRGVIYGEPLVRELLALIERTQAELVYAPSVMEMHPDHRALGMACVEAVRRRGGALRIAQYEIGVPLRPNLLLDITPVAARKLEAMQCFTSQLEHQRYDLDISALNRYRSWSLPAEVTAAEAFLVASGEELQGDPLGIYQSEYVKQSTLGLAFDSRDLPLVTVMIRSSDRASLSLALDSVAMQTYQNIEVVVVDATGGAHRPLGDWCGRFPLRLVQHGHKLERAVAANAALDAARGDYLIFLDDDDLFLPHHLARLVDELRRSEGSIAVYAGVVGVDGNGTEVQRFDDAWDPVRLRLGNYIPIHALLFRRTALAQGARFDESLPLCEDWDFWLQLAAQAKFRHVPGIGAVYNMHTDDGSGIWVNKDLVHRVVLGLLRKWLPKWDDATLWGLMDYTRYRLLYDDLNKDMLRKDAQSAQRLEVVEQINAELRNRVEEQNYWIARLQDSVKDYKTALSAREAHLETIVNSTSWRMTQPLRAAVDKLRGKAPLPEVGARQEPQAAPASLPVEAAPEKHTYDYVVPLDSQTAPVFVTELVGKDKRVLEIGCGPGSITKMMKQVGGCRVTGIEVDPAAIALAREHCEAIYSQDLNAEDWPEVLGRHEPFDTVVAADVLEHLYDPWRTLRQMAGLIAPQGSIVVSLPHAGHAALVASLVNNDVAYQDCGLLDRTHIRFFGLKNIEALFAQAQLKIVEARFVIIEPEQTELAEQWQQVSEFVRAALRTSRYANIFQVVVRAVPIGQPGTPLSLLNPD
jgi:LmbE family N-acetylglucosaminyl deacetylase/2-polyprenyl-3-methyl-5-hydroxy-6-metoxy-1,4-benzoquinol methylase/glycosyltransferase involved in cell wall biosynthesis